MNCVPDSDVGAALVIGIAVGVVLGTVLCTILNYYRGPQS